MKIYPTPFVNFNYDSNEENEYSSTSGNVVFAVSQQQTSSPINGWTVQIVKDVNCNGQVDCGIDTIIGDAANASSNQAVVANTPYCILVKNTPPQGAGGGSSDVVTVTANFNGLGVTASTTKQDRTVVSNGTNGGGGGDLQLVKEVRNVTQGTEFTRNNQGKSGDVLEYRITYTNPTGQAMSNVKINDATPGYIVNLEKYGIA